MGNNTGCLECFDESDYTVAVKTGDTKGAGLHNSAHIKLINERNEESRKIQLSGCCVTVFKKGKTDTFNVKKLPDFGRVKEVIVEQHKEQNDVEWYIDRIVVSHQHEERQRDVVFPVNRWLRMDKPLRLSEYDSLLPQYDTNIEQRSGELKLKRMIYAYRKTDVDLPPKMNHIPRDEVFSNFYKWDIHQKRDSVYSIYQIPKYETPESWKSFEEIEALFKDKGKFRRPKVLDMDWKSDLHFGQQRLKGCNPKSLRLCEEIPSNFAVTEEMLAEYLEGFSLNEALKEKKLFLVNHSILDDIRHIDDNDNTLCSPMALFYLNTAEDLIPIAIQLFQSCEDEPVFLPNDPIYTWMLAKMWFNNADAIVQRIQHLITSSHWIMENISLAVHRSLSPSHPIFRLLAPYLRHVLAINHFEMHPLLATGGLLEKVLPITNEEIMNLIKACWLDFDFKKKCCLREELKENKVLDAEVIGKYPYRDDGLLLYGIIEDFAREITDIIYHEEGDLEKDTEIQMLAAELVSDDSCNFKNVPGNGQFETTEDLVCVLTCILYKATVEHAALNLPLYDEGAFIPNYPLMLRGVPPDNKDPLTEEDVMLALPTKRITMETIALNKVLSERDSSGLADSRTIYQHDPASKPAKERFEGGLRAASALISIRNRERNISYDYLNPGKPKPHLS